MEDIKKTNDSLYVEGESHTFQVVRKYVGDYSERAEEPPLAVRGSLVRCAVSHFEGRPGRLGCRSEGRTHLNTDDMNSVLRHPGVRSEHGLGHGCTQHEQECSMLNKIDNLGTSCGRTLKRQDHSCNNNPQERNQVSFIVEKSSENTDPHYILLSNAENKGKSGYRSQHEAVHSLLSIERVEELSSDCVQYETDQCWQEITLLSDERMKKSTDESGDSAQNEFNLLSIMEKCGEHTRNAAKRSSSSSAEDMVVTGRSTEQRNFVGASRTRGPSDVATLRAEVKYLRREVALRSRALETVCRKYLALRERAAEQRLRLQLDLRTLEEVLGEAIALFECPQCRAPLEKERTHPRETLCGTFRRLRAFSWQL